MMSYDDNSEEYALGILLFAGGVVVLSLLASIMAFVAYTNEDFSLPTIQPPAAAKQSKSKLAANSDGMNGIS